MSATSPAWLDELLDRAPIEVRGGVPRFADDPGAGDIEKGETIEAFSEKWTRVDSDEVRQRYAQQHAWYVERYGLRDDDGLRALIADAGTILEAGTGTGGDADRFARLAPDAKVIGLDISAAIDVAQREFGGGKRTNLAYVQADLTDPPFADGSFGFVSCDQVLHHTPDAARSYATLARLVKPGGAFAAYVYKVKAPLRELADDWIRERTTKLPPEEGLAFARQMTMLGRVLSELDAKVTLPEAIPLLEIPAGEHDVQRLVYWHFLKCFYNKTFSDNLNDLVNFDWYAPVHASRHTREEVEGWVADAGLVVEHLDDGDAGISVLARRPMAG